MKKILVGAGLLLGLAFTQQTEAQGKSNKHSSQSTHKVSKYDRSGDVIVTTRTSTYHSYNGYQPAKKAKYYRAKHNNGLHRGWYIGKHKGWYKKSRRRH